MEGGLRIPRTYKAFRLQLLQHGLSHALRSDMSLQARFNSRAGVEQVAQGVSDEVEGQDC